MKFPCYLVHPNHGVHVAYSEDEVERCRAHGWVPREERGEVVMKTPATVVTRTTLKLPKRKDEAP